MDGADGWRYWWDAAAQQWQQHAQMGTAAAAAEEQPGQQSTADARAAALSPILEGDTPAASPALPSQSAGWPEQPSGQAASDWEDSFGLAASGQPAAAQLAPEAQQYSAAPSVTPAGQAGPAAAVGGQQAQEAGGAAWSHTSWQPAQQAVPFAEPDAASADDWQLVSEQDAWQAGAPQQQQQPYQLQGPEQQQQQQQQQQNAPWQPASLAEPEQAAAPTAQTIPMLPGTVQVR